MYINGICGSSIPRGCNPVVFYFIPLCLCHCCFVLFSSLWHRQVLRESEGRLCRSVKSSSTPRWKAPCSSSMVILLLYLSSASCLPSNKHHPRLAIPLVIWKRTGDQWQGCCHGTVYSCRVEFCCKARESQSLLASSRCRCNLRCLAVSTGAERDLVEASQSVTVWRENTDVCSHFSLISSPHCSQQQREGGKKRPSGAGNGCV